MALFVCPNTHLSAIRCARTAVSAVATDKYTWISSKSLTASSRSYSFCITVLCSNNIVTRALKAQNPRRFMCPKIKYYQTRTRYAHAQQNQLLGGVLQPTRSSPWQFSMELGRRRLSKNPAYIRALEPLKPLVSLVCGRLTRVFPERKWPTSR